MALDGMMLSMLRRELQGSLIGARIDKIYQPSREELVFLLRTQEGSRRLLLETRGEISVFGILREHDLYGNRTSKDVVLPLIHFGHAADADTLTYEIAVVEQPSCQSTCHVNTPLCFVLVKRGHFGHTNHYRTSSYKTPFICSAVCKTF